MLVGVQICLNYLAAVEEFGALVQYWIAYVKVLLVVQAETRQFFLPEIQEQEKRPYNLLAVIRSNMLKSTFKLKSLKTLSEICQKGLCLDIYWPKGKQTLARR